MSRQIVEGLKLLYQEQCKTNALLEKVLPLLEVQTRLLCDQAQLTLEQVMTPALRPFEEWPEGEDGACGKCGCSKVEAPNEPGDQKYEARVCVGCGKAWKVLRLLTCAGCGSKHPANRPCHCGHGVPPR